MFTATIRFGFGGLKQPFTLTRNFAVLAKNIVKNEFIAAATIRLVMKNQATGKSSHDIMTKAEALEVAKSEKLDLILGTLLFRSVCSLLLTSVRSCSKWPK